jgi:enoyl-CoA hydratase/carnithine racemase
MAMSLMIGLLVWSGLPPAQITIDRILAVVNGDPITLSDVRAARLLKLVPADTTDVVVVDTLVERRLVLTEMRRFQAPEPTPEALAARRAEWTQRVAGAQPEALAAAAGVGAEYVDRWLADDLRREAYLQQRFAALDAARRVEAIRLWIESLRVRADVVYRIQRF